MFKIGQKYRSLRVKWCQTLWVAEEVQILRERATVLRYMYIACLIAVVLRTRLKMSLACCFEPNAPSAKATINLSGFVHLYKQFLIPRTNHQMVPRSRQKQLLFSVQGLTLAADLLVQMLRIRGAVPSLAHTSP